MSAEQFNSIRDLLKILAENQQVSYIQISDLVSIVIALAAFGLSLWSYFEIKKTERRNATWEAISEIKSELFERNYAMLLDFLSNNSESDLYVLMFSGEPEGNMLSHAFRFVLDTAEDLCLKINNQEIDSSIVKMSSRNYLVKLYDRTSRIIANLRNKEQNPRIYCELEKVAERWRSNV